MNTQTHTHYQLYLLFSSLYCALLYHKWIPLLPHGFFRLSQPSDSAPGRLHSSAAALGPAEGRQLFAQMRPSKHWLFWHFALNTSIASTTAVFSPATWKVSKAYFDRGHLLLQCSFFSSVLKLKATSNEILFGNDYRYIITWQVFQLLEHVCCSCALTERAEAPTSTRGVRGNLQAALPNSAHAGQEQAVPCGLPQTP